LKQTQQLLCAFARSFVVREETKQESHYGPQDGTKERSAFGNVREWAIPVFPVEIVVQGCDYQHPKPPAENSTHPYVLRKGEGLRSLFVLPENKWFEYHSERANKQSND
jgi:hypothetical protein